MRHKILINVTYEADEKTFPRYRLISHELDPFEIYMLPGITDEMCPVYSSRGTYLQIPGYNMLYEKLSREEQFNFDEHGEQ